MTAQRTRKPRKIFFVSSASHDVWNHSDTYTTIEPNGKPKEQNEWIREMKDTHGDPPPDLHIGHSSEPSIEKGNQ